MATQRIEIRVSIESVDAPALKALRAHPILQPYNLARHSDGSATGRRAMRVTEDLATATSQITIDIKGAVEQSLRHPDAVVHVLLATQPPVK